MHQCSHVCSWKSKFCYQRHQLTCIGQVRRSFRGEEKIEAEAEEIVTRQVELNKTPTAIHEHFYSATSRHTRVSLFICLMNLRMHSEDST